jgi:hypothetical protein
LVEAVRIVMPSEISDTCRFSELSPMEPDIAP